jgi:hypothetical protein
MRRAVDTTLAGHDHIVDVVIGNLTVEPVNWDDARSSRSAVIHRIHGGAGRRRLGHAGDVDQGSVATMAHEQVAERRTYQDRRPRALPASLSDLKGEPSEGSVELRPAVAWTGSRSYDLDAPEDRVVMYERVIVEAPKSAARQALLNEAILVRIRPSLYLPGQVRTLWPSRLRALPTAA